MMPSGRYVLACHIASISWACFPDTSISLASFKGRVQIAALPTDNIEATSFAASIPAVSLSNMMTTRSKLSTNSKFLATAFFAPAAPVPTETQGKRLPCACDIERQSTSPSVITSILPPCFHKCWP